MSLATPAEWSRRYREDDTPWDMRRPMPLLMDLIEEDPALGGGEPGRVFVPGCGTGWDASVFYRAGWEVVAVDLSDEAIRRAQRLIPEDVDTALGEGFTRIETGPEITIGRRSWPHRLCVWKRLD